MLCRLPGVAVMLWLLAVVVEVMTGCLIDHLSAPGEEKPCRDEAVTAPSARTPRNKSLPPHPRDDAAILRGVMTDRSPRHRPGLSTTPALATHRQDS